ncbi:DUF5677 domain-containing protein [Paraburkholderia hospita]|uniref:DUF5677 domain-containing protein n=1 Tax=Paraburkholderia hospita TaxID=169430 RepID=UPI0008A766A2|nr:DUF5677 domain-containing protein [Paraburkholderia hospita]SEI14723.1 hypothetical protein SAMN05192544_102597 [Paraburkholderia hospita]
MAENYHHEPHFTNLLQLLIAMVQSQAGIRIPKGLEWQNDRQTLAKKLAFHLHTIRTLGGGSKLEIDGLQTPFVDHGSIKVLARSVLENYIVFAFIFGDPSLEVSRFRHMTWRLAGLMDRQRRIPLTAENRQKLAGELMEVEALRREIEAHSIFAGHSTKERKALAKGDWSAGKQWHELAVEAGLHQRYFRNIYGYLCDYSHSSYAAALQVGEASTVEQQRAISNGMFGMLNMTMAHFVAVYAKLFESARQLLEQSPVRETAERWRFTAAQLDAIYGTASEAVSKG